MDICTLASGHDLRIDDILTQRGPEQYAVLLSKGSVAHAEYFQDRISAQRFALRLRLADAAGAQGLVGPVQDFFWTSLVEQLPGVVVAVLMRADAVRLGQYILAYSLLAGETAFQGRADAKAALLAISAASRSC